MATKTTAPTKAELQALLKAGAHFGHKTSHWNPKMRSYIHSERSGIHIIDLVQTAERLHLAEAAVREVAASGKDILFVGTKRNAQQAIRSAAGGVAMPFVVNRWFGGLLTNYATVRDRLKHLSDLEDKLASGQLSKTHSKREINELQNEADELNNTFEGIKGMSTLPGAVFVADMRVDALAIKEAARLGIVTIATSDTNTNPDLVDYPIPANDDAVATVSMIADRLATAAKEGAAKKQIEATDEE